MSGSLAPLAVGVDGGYILDQRVAPAPRQSWGGASGAAVFCEELLVGVVARDDTHFLNRRLHAIRASAVVSDPDFARLLADDIGAPPILEAVELTALTPPPADPTKAQTPGSLLAADIEAVKFIGRTKILDDLRAWRDSPAKFAINLIVGEGGQGKTRLARQFAAQARSNDWVVVFTRVAAMRGADDIDRNNIGHALASTVRASSRPILLIADYAETHPDDIGAIADELMVSAPQSHVRVLLLARAAGAWWRNLADAMHADTAQLVELPPLTDSITERKLAYAIAVNGLAPHLDLLSTPPVDKPGQMSWQLAASRLASDPPDLSDARFGNALTLQIAALIDLLSQVSGDRQRRIGVSEEQELISHERRYLRRAAARRGGLFTGSGTN